MTLSAPIAVLWILLVILGGLLAWLIRCIVIVPTNHVCLIQRLGQYNRKMTEGIHVLAYPFEGILDIQLRKYHFVSEIPLYPLRFDPPPFEVLTMDKIAIHIDVFMMYQIQDVLKFFNNCRYNVEVQLQLQVENALVTCASKLTFEETKKDIESIQKQILEKLISFGSTYGLQMHNVFIQKSKHPPNFKKYWNERKSNVGKG